MPQSNAPHASIARVLILLASVSTTAWAQQPTCSSERAASGDPGQVAVCRDLSEREPENSTAWEGLGSALAQAGDYANAARAWQQYVRLEPNEVQGHHNLGLMYEFLRQSDSALAAFERALQLEASDPRMLQTLAWHIGVQHGNSRRQELALAWFREAAALDSTDASAWHYAALSAARLGRHAEAMALWARALALAPDFLGQLPEGQRAFYERAHGAVGAQPLAPVASPGVLERARGRPHN